MWLKITLITALLLSGCNISRSFQPPTKGYEKFYKYRYNDTPSEVVKQDMLNCGFPNVYNNAPMLNHDINAYTKSMLCMVAKGYDSHMDICEVKHYRTTEACQKHLAQ